MLMLSAPASARTSAEELQDRLEQASVRLTTLELDEHADAAALEFGQARLEIAEAQGQLTADDYGAAAILLARLEARIDLIESAIQRDTVESLADQRETDLFDMQTEADEAQLLVETLQQQRHALQDDVETIVDQMNAEGP